MRLQSFLDSARRHAPAPETTARRATLLVFEEAYSDFVEAVCDAAQYGPTLGLRAAYVRAREQAAQLYPELRVWLSAYCSPSPEDAFLCRRWLGTDGDAFDALFAPETLDQFLESDDGAAMSRLLRTREALGMYAQHLNGLAKKQ